jgi:hypothetical protein
MKAFLKIMVYIIFLMGVVFLQTTYGQTSAPEKPIKTEIVGIDLNTIDWVFYAASDSIRVYYKKIACDEQKNHQTSSFIVLRFENNTNNEYRIKWINRLFSETNSYPQNPNDIEAHREITLSGNSVLEGNCTSSALRIFLKNQNREDVFKITGFQLDKMAVRHVDQVVSD